MFVSHLTCFLPPQSWCCRGAVHRPPPWTGPASPRRPGRSSSWPRTSCWSPRGRPAGGPSEGPTSCAEEQEGVQTVSDRWQLHPCCASSASTASFLHTPVLTGDYLPSLLLHPFNAFAFILSFQLTDNSLSSFTSSPSADWPSFDSASHKLPASLSLPSSLCVLPLLWQQVNEKYVFVI